MLNKKFEEIEQHNENFGSENRGLEQSDEILKNLNDAYAYIMA